ncbi:hypothetical protein [Pseudovibrio exalbescens]|uniref:hypothetical protein n=1 Tax=Pseudovibrio exalbescens TaxID=197461 RepID=UPI000C9C4CA8|nr:hypothetical protein [Pseudovibrio exalbescens]
MERTGDNVANAIPENSKLVEELIVNGVADLTEKAGIVVHTHATSHISMQALNLEVIGLPAFRYVFF